MEQLARHLGLVRLMMSEERRLNASMIGGIQFLMFPVIILFMALVLSLASSQLLRSMPLDQAYLLLHAVIVLYGISVGGLALFSDRIAERRFGQTSLILQTPLTQPIDGRELFAAFYVKEIIYYFLYSIVPIIGGIALSIPVTGFPVTSVLFLLLTTTLSFLIGLSLSFFLSSMYVRSRALFGVLVGVMAVVFLTGFVTKAYDVADLIPSIALQRTHEPLYLAIALAVIALFSFVAIMTIQVKYSGRASERHEARMLETAGSFTFARSCSALMGKDWIDLLRSRTLVPVVSAYVGPLAILALMFWFIGNVLTVRLDLNMVFYAAMIGFFSVSIYSWLNMLDNNAFMEVLPVTVAQVIRTKLLLLSMVAAVTSTVFLIALGAMMGQLGTLPLGLVVGYVTTAYTVTSTAYLTGLRTNSYLFDPAVLAKFSGLSIPPLVALVIMSLSFWMDPLVVSILVLAVCGVLALVTYLLYRRIDARWGRESFVYQ